MQFRTKKDDFEYNDNIILWQEAINDKISKTREQKTQFYTFYDNQSIIGVSLIEEDFELLLSQLAHKEWYLPFLDKMTGHRKAEWLSVRVLLKELLNEEKEIRYFPSGKPYLADNSYHISISHTKEYVAVILNKEKEVAIDIEKISPRVENISSRFMNEDEVTALSKENRLIHLVIHWSAKESMFKILNEENVEFKTQLHLSSFEPLMRKWDSFSAHETRSPKQNIFTINYYVHEDYVLTYI
jgi:4'-phosphopantetheinyl transferase EntD